MAENLEKWAKIGILHLTNIQRNGIVILRLIIEKEEQIP